MTEKVLVIKSTGKFYTVQNEDGKTYECTVKGKFRLKGLKLTNPVAVGDHVLIDTDSLVIEDILDRENYIIRQSPKKKHAEQIIASNIDQAILITTFSMPRTSTGFMDRFLITAEAYHIKSIILFNKADLLSESEISEVKERMKIYESAGYECYLISVIEEIGLEVLNQKLKNKITLLCGHSGVGKSSLINSLLPDKEIATREISDYSEKGLHTTTFAEMHDLPDGGKIIDTPGIKEFGVLDFDASEVGHCFPEMRDYLSDCKFHNCLHLDEPKCAVRQAVENDNISEERYKNYKKIVMDVKNEIKPWE
ncbi:MAG: ribosome small subunit-dependent GTPase A [Chitinophagales bacterium]|nr:ribosome small subunit-dependent GTPase A [Chitinophagales bacterium]